KLGEKSRPLEGIEVDAGSTPARSRHHIDVRHHLQTMGELGNALSVMRRQVPGDPSHRGVAERAEEGVAIAKKRPKDIAKLVGVGNRRSVTCKLFILPASKCAEVDLEPVGKLEHDAPW